jgi:tetratricopeptide (TPR) repeat protein
MPLDETEKDHLLELLDGLPLAIAQAGAYIQTTGSGLTKYISFYEKQWDELMTPGPLNDPALKDYPDRSVWTTWTISYHAIREKHEHTANLLLLWSFLDNKDFWYDLLAVACKSYVAADMLSRWVGEIANSEIQFTGAMRLLRNYSLVEEITGTTSYATHPVVHQWTRYSQGTHFETDLMQLAIVVVGQCVPHHHELDYYALQRRLLPHAQVCFNHVVETKAFDRLGAEEGHDEDTDQFEEHETFLSALSDLGLLYKDQNKFSKAEALYTRALRGMENTLGPSNESILRLIGDMGVLYDDRGKLLEAEKMQQRALRGKEEVLGSTHTSTLKTVHNIGVIYQKQGKLIEAEKMYERALRGKEEVLGPTHPSTLETMNNLSVLYQKQGKLAEAEEMFRRVLRGSEEMIGKEHVEHYLPALKALHYMGVVYYHQGRVAKAEKMYERAYRGYEEAFGKDNVNQHQGALEVLWSMGILYAEQGEIAKAKAVWERALSGYSNLLDPSSEDYKTLVGYIDGLSIFQEEVGKCTEQVRDEEKGNEETKEEVLRKEAHLQKIPRESKHEEEKPNDEDYHEIQSKTPYTPSLQPASPYSGAERSSKILLRKKMKSLFRNSGSI